ncbi:hypothetical protein G6011_00140 [Alternaria panax]|uniref:Cytochrome P450 monooxygenase n=1 Tax=Alternaria panax TaxID=48097 RepID=A0AAD4IIB6_9PLEO|nr:hypothetical protein G6011_00140 [Alternaria panax]
MNYLWELIRNCGSKELVVSLLGIWLLYWLAIGIYRVYFHPLSKIPGPKLAAFTFWYEFYYEIYPHRYQYLWKIKELHEKYGPIIRINPLHVHIHDADYFDTIYASGVNHKRDRCSWSHHTGSKTWEGAILETMDHEMHKMRRNAVSPFFSKRSVQALEGLVVNNMKKLLHRFDGEMEKNGIETGIVNLNDAYAAFAMDVISEYCFGESMKSLENGDYGKDWLAMMHEGMQLVPFARQFPMIFNFILDLPPHLAAKLNAGAGKLNAYNSQMLGKIEHIMNRKDGDDEAKHLQRTIFHDIRDDVGGKLPEKEKHPVRLMADASVILGAGTETTSRTMAVATYYLIKNPETAVINEGLRCAHGVSSRQPRIATGEDLHYAQYTIPRGTPVMQSSYLLHMDPTIYPDPFAFRPERWLENPKLIRYLFAFGRGSRNCLGMNLAMSELYFGLAMIWRKFQLELYDTVESRDVLTTHDCFLGMTDLTSGGVKVKIVGEVKG